VTDNDRTPFERRLLVLAPTGRDAALTRAVFERAHVATVFCKDLDAICVELEKGAGALLLPEESVGEEGCPGNFLGILLALRSSPWGIGRDAIP